VTSYSRQDVLRILQIGSRQLQVWERAGIVPQQQSYSFQDLGQLRILRALREEAVSVASIRHSIVAMKAVAGMANPLLEASLVRTGTRLAFRHHGAMVDPIRRQLLFDFERLDQQMGRPSATSEPAPLRRPVAGTPRGVQEMFLEAVQAEEAGEKIRAIKLYQEIMELRSQLCAGLDQSGDDSLPSARVWLGRAALPPGDGDRSKLCAGVF
jgi:DNA-binding transcriptional MerR regulator